MNGKYERKNNTVNTTTENQLHQPMHNELNKARKFMNHIKLVLQGEPKV